MNKNEKEGKIERKKKKDESQGETENGRQREKIGDISINITGIQTANPCPLRPI